MIAPIVGQLALAGAGEIATAIEHVPGGRRIEAAEDVQQGRFAAAGRAEQHHQFAAVQIEVDAAQRLHLDLAHGVDLGDVVDVEDDVGAWIRMGVRMAVIGVGFGHGCARSP